MKKILVILSFLIPYFGFAQADFYRADKIQKIELFFSASNYDYQMDTAIIGTGGYIAASRVIINGISFDSVGVRFKGNSSYDSTYTKNPWHIELNTYREQSYYGLTDIKLGNGYADPSVIREALSYEILGNYMDCPRSNFAEFYINGVFQGLFSNQESITKYFTGNLAGNFDHALIKCNPNINPGPANKCNMKFISSDTSSYYLYYDLKSDYGWTELMHAADTITNFPSRIASQIDVDKFLWMLAFDNLFVNLDSYMGAFCQNYYLYRDQNGLFCPVIWDLNMSFGGFPFSGTPNNGLGALNVTGMQQMSPTLHAGQADWPVINVLLSDARYKKMYVAHMRAMIENYFSNGVYKTMAAKWQIIADSSVVKDTVAFYSYAQFQNGMTQNNVNGSYTIPGISTLMDARTTYLLNTTEFKQTHPIISGVNLSTNTPQVNETITIKVKVADAANVFVYTRFSPTSVFNSMELFDDGQHNDGIAGDSIYGGTVSMNAEIMEYYFYSENANAGYFLPENAAHQFFTLEVPRTKPLPGELVINEFLASNKKADINEYGLYTDWIELYNTTNKTLSLFGMYLSDHKIAPHVYTFPSGTTIAPYGYVTLWADGLKNKRWFHAPFTLSSTGGEIILTNAAGLLFDSLTYDSQISDVSRGRCPDGSNYFTSISTPSYLGSNNGFCITATEDIKQDEIGVYPNPANQYINIQMREDEKIFSFSITDLMGKEITSFKTNGNFQTVSTGAISNGLYLLRGMDAAQHVLLTKKIIIAH